MKNNNPNTKNEILKAFRETFQWKAPNLWFWQDNKIQQPLRPEIIEEWLSSKLQEVERAAIKETASKIVIGIDEMESGTGNIAICNCGCPKGIKWGIMKGWGIEPERLAQLKGEHHE